MSLLSEGESELQVIGNDEKRVCPICETSSIWRDLENDEDRQLAYDVTCENCGNFQLSEDAYITLVEMNEQNNIIFVDRVRDLAKEVHKKSKIMTSEHIGEIVRHLDL